MTQISHGGDLGEKARFRVEDEVPEGVAPELAGAYRAIDAMQLFAVNWPLRVRKLVPDELFAKLEAYADEPDARGPVPELHRGREEGRKGGKEDNAEGSSAECEGKGKHERERERGEQKGEAEVGREGSELE